MSERSTVPTTVAPPRAEARIDLSALRANVAAMRSRLTGGAQLWAVVKANAYGHDVEHVAEAVVAAGARRLCVATLSEARELRSLGIRVPILVMGPLDAPSMRRAIDLDVSVTVLSRVGIEAFESAAAASGGARIARAHLKVDTGMGRWGVPRAEASAALDRLLDVADAELEGVMTHFATADQFDDAGSTTFARQVDAFDEVVAMARGRVPGVVAHAANSAATLRDERAHHDAVRCGVALYGMDPMQQDPEQHGLQPVLSLRSHVADVRELASGEGVGYGQTWLASDPTRVGLVPIGYADGLRRLLSNRGEVLVRGERRSIVGTISMDQLAIVAGSDVQAGDVVTLLGSDGGAWLRAEDHARWAETINYEITCGIAGEPRLVRVHEPTR